MFDIVSVCNLDLCIVQRIAFPIHIVLQSSQRTIASEITLSLSKGLIITCIITYFKGAKVLLTKTFYRFKLTKFSLTVLIEGKHYRHHTANC